MESENFHTNEEEWEVLSGCERCINSAACRHLGNCIILSIDIIYPEENQDKIKILKKLKGSICRPDLYAQEIQMKVSRANKREKEEKFYRTWDGPVKLSVIERMCIEELKRPR